MKKNNKVINLNFFDLSFLKIIKQLFIYYIHL